MKTTSYIPFVLPGLAVTDAAWSESELLLEVQSVEASARCPRCGEASQRFHSSYQRSVQDTPIGFTIVQLKILVRRFRCANGACVQKTFAEQFPDLVGRRRRRTKRLMSNLTHIGLALGGEAGVWLAEKLTMTASASTVLRQLHQLEVPPIEAPVVIGIDDWAFRKGRDYGTIIINHETGKPIDLLPERDCATVKQWLEQYPTIEIVTRDRSGEYRDAITQALPNATQIADRWHLVKNLREAVERYLSRRYKAIRKLFVAAATVDADEIEVANSTKRRRYEPGPARKELHAARTQKREALFAEVKQRYAAGAYTTDIARDLNISRALVSLWVNSDTLPPDSRGRFKRKCLIDDYVPYLNKRIAEGCRNQSQLWREICEQGFTGCRELIGKWMRQNGKQGAPHQQQSAPAKPKVVVPHPVELSWLLMRQDDKLDEEGKGLMNVLMQDASFADLRRLVHAFLHMVRNHFHTEWTDWLRAVEASAVKELRNFAIGLKRDAAAVYAAIEQGWSNGPTEGNVNRLKFLKRQMYGRASFKLLRIRVLLTDR